MRIQNQVTELLQIEQPILMAPMFLVSNPAMIQAALQRGIMGVFPSLNFRNDGELKQVIQQLHQFKLESSSKGNFGVNLIVQKSNVLLEKHLQVCIDEKVPFYISSLGNPSDLIREANSYGAKVFCDVTTMAHAEKCAISGAHGFIAVGQGAGGHAGNNPLQILIPALKKEFPSLPVVAAGGISTGAGMLSAMAAGAQAVSIGTRFIASDECAVNKDYKQGILNAKMKDIVLTEKLSGTPCTIINNEAAQRLGLRQNALERYLSKHPLFKKYFKLLLQVRGMKKLQDSLLPNAYNQLWCAGQSVELIDEVRSCATIVDVLLAEYEQAYQELAQQLKF